MTKTIKYAILLEVSSLVLSVYNKVREKMNKGLLFCLAVVVALGGLYLLKSAAVCVPDEVSVHIRPLEGHNGVITVADGDTLNIVFNNDADGTPCCRVWVDPSQLMEICDEETDLLHLAESGDDAVLGISSYTIRVYDPTNNRLVCTAYLRNTLDSPRSLTAPSEVVTHRPHRPKASTASM